MENPVKKAIIVGALTALTNIPQPAAAAQNLRCETSNYGHALNSASGNSSQALEIIKSWIPEEMFITEDLIAFPYFEITDVRKSGDNRIKGYLKTEDSSGRKANLVYDILLKDGKSSAWVTMRQRGYKDMGPVVFKCEAF